MSGLSFFPRGIALSLAVLIDLAEAEGDEGLDLSKVFDAVAALDHAGPGDVSAFEQGDLDDLRATRAGACFVAHSHIGDVPSCTIALVTATPLIALGRVAAVMHPGATAGPLLERTGVDAAATVHGDASLEQGVSIDPGVVVGPRVEIGSGTIIGANSVIGAGVRIGRGCVIDAQVSISHALIGDRVTIGAGARIGGLSDNARPSLGRVIVQDGAFVCSNTVIERGRLGDTTIGEGAMIGALTIVHANTVVARGEIRRATAFPPSSEMV